MGTTETWGLILGMALVTYLIRYLPLAYLSQAEIPSWFTRWLELATAAILAAMLAPTVLIAKDRIDLSLSNASFWAAIPAALVAWRTRNIMLTILVGMAASAVIQQAVW